MGPKHTVRTVPRCPFSVPAATKTRVSGVARRNSTDRDSTSDYAGFLGFSLIASEFRSALQNLHPRFNSGRRLHFFLARSRGCFCVCTNQVPTMPKLCPRSATRLELGSTASALSEEGGNGLGRRRIDSAGSGQVLRGVEGVEFPGRLCKIRLADDVVAQFGRRRARSTSADPTHYLEAACVRCEACPPNARGRLIS
jgi:hypothetical protein